MENPVTNDDIPRVRVNAAFRVTKIVALKIGGGIGSFDWEIRHSPNANDQGVGTLIKGDTGTSNETTGDEFLPPSFDSGDPTTVPADDWIWMELPSVSTGLARPVACTVMVFGFEV